MKNTLILFLFSASLMAFAQQSHPKFDSLANELVSNTTIPSVVFSYITPDTCLYGVAGVNNLNDKKEVQLTDKFSLGSNTKAITALIAMKMVEKGQITLDTKLLEVIPSLKMKIKKTYRKITLGELLSHRAHVRAYTAGEDYEDFPEELPENLVEQREIFVKHVLNQEPMVTELSHDYSNAGYVIASHMMEIAAGKSYEELVDEFMNDMGYAYYFGFANREDAAAPSGYIMLGEVWTEIGPTHEYNGLPVMMNAAGMLSMNILDYSRLLQMQLKGLNGADTYISSESMNTHHFGLKEYAYGWLNGYNGMKFSTHEGALSSNHCLTVLLPEIPCAFSIFINSDLPEHVQAMQQMAQKVVGEMLR